MNTFEQLNQINEAISAIEGGAQEYRTKYKTFIRPDLGTLYAERKRLQAQYNQEQSDAPPGVYVARFDRR